MANRRRRARHAQSEADATVQIREGGTAMADDIRDEDPRGRLNTFRNGHWQLHQSSSVKCDVISTEARAAVPQNSDG